MTAIPDGTATRHRSLLRRKARRSFLAGIAAALVVVGSVRAAPEDAAIVRRVADAFRAKSPRFEDGTCHRPGKGLMSDDVDTTAPSLPRKSRLAGDPAALDLAVAQVLGPRRRRSEDPRATRTSPASGATPAKGAPPVPRSSGSPARRPRRGFRPSCARNPCSRNHP